MTPATTGSSRLMTPARSASMIRCAHAERLNAMAEQPSPVTITATTTAAVTVPTPSNAAITTDPMPIVTTCTKINANVSKRRVTSPVPINQTAHANAVINVTPSPKDSWNDAPVSRNNPASAHATAATTRGRGGRWYRNAAIRGVKTTNNPVMKLELDVEVWCSPTFCVWY